MAQASYKAQDYQHAGTSTANDMKSTANDMKEKMHEGVDRASQHMHGMAHQAQQQAGVMGENMKQVASNLDSAMRRSIQEQPMTTLAMAAAVGFVLGAIWKS